MEIEDQLSYDSRKEDDLDYDESFIEDDIKDKKNKNKKINSDDEFEDFDYESNEFK